MARKSATKDVLEKVRINRKKSQQQARQDKET